MLPGHLSACEQGGKAHHICWKQQSSWCVRVGAVMMSQAYPLQQRTKALLMLNSDLLAG